MEKSMDIAEQRKKAGMSQMEFSRFTGIPVGTLRNWEQGKTKTPSYIKTLVYEALRRSTMINLETVQFIAMLNELVEKEKAGIKEFKDATAKDKDDCIFYDATACSRRDDGALMYQVVLASCIDENHHDIIAYYSNHDYDVHVVNDGESIWLEVHVLAEDEYIEFGGNSGWYFV